MRLFNLILLISLLNIYACVSKSEVKSAINEPEKIDYKFSEKFVHDKNSFTQGLEIYNNYLYESSGLYGKSKLKKIDLQTYELIKEVNIEKQYFAEGITILDNKIYQLTWKSKKGFIYNPENLEKISEFEYPTEGWGITNNGKNLIISDGTNKLYFYDSDDFNQIKTISVKSKDIEIYNLNELEFINGKIYANIWQTDLIAIINPENGNVEKWLSLTNIIDRSKYKNIDVLNGIAFNKDSNKLIVTGKLWPYYFLIEIKGTKNE